MLTFDPIKHEYRYNGQVVPSVTQVIGAIDQFRGINSETLAAAGDRGTAVHRAAELHDLGTLDESSVDPAIHGYLEGWRRFMREIRPEWAGIEQQVYHEAFRYAGTLDRYGIVQGQTTVLDIKTAAAKSPWWGVQTAAYARAISKTDVQRMTIQLTPDGFYKLNRWEDKADFPVFASLLTIHGFLKRTQP